jgi:hypothetical protein
VTHPGGEQLTPRGARLRDAGYATPERVGRGLRPVSPREPARDPLRQP